MFYTSEYLVRTTVTAALLVVRREQQVNNSLNGERSETSCWRSPCDRDRCAGVTSQVVTGRVRE